MPDRVKFQNAMESDSLHNISDTALWVAQYRVMETGRGDAISATPSRKSSSATGARRSSGR